MKYTKPPLTLEQQAELLLSRGMTGDKSLMIERLNSVNYYRLSGYWFPFRNPSDPKDSFRPGTTFDAVWDRYVFDRKLRLLVMDAIERIEIAIRTQLAHHHSLAHGCFAYSTDSASLPKLVPQQYEDFLRHVEKETERSRETFVDHFRDKYGDGHSLLPVWMATEVMTFGTVLTFFRGVDQDVKRLLAQTFGVPDIVLESWLFTLNAIRNICAHHGRLWNRELGLKPKLPLERKYPEWHRPVPVGNDRMFAILTICRHCLARIAPQSHWPQRVLSLLESSPNIPLLNMGFPNDWGTCAIWQEPQTGGGGSR